MVSFTGESFTLGYRIYMNWPLSSTKGIVKERNAGEYWGRFAHSYDRDGEYVVGHPILQAIETRLFRERCLGYLVECE